MSEVANDLQEPTMSDEDVASALADLAATEAGGGEQAVEDTDAVETPEGTDGEQPGVEDVEDSGAVEDPTAETFNPDLLPPELRQGWRQLQSAFTPRLQEAAEMKRQFEAFGGSEDIAAAAELYNRLRDPQSWPGLAAELQEAMREVGVQVPDPGQPETPAPVAPPSLEFDDPDLAPFAEALTAIQQQNQLLQARLGEYDAEREALAAQEAHRVQMEERNNSLIGMLEEIQEANPHYEQDDLADILKLAPFYGDNLYEAAEVYESSFERRMNRLYEQKNKGKSPAIQPPKGAGVESAEAEEIRDIRGVEDGAVEYMRQLQAQGLFD